jgi:hypothetical protein
MAAFHPGDSGGFYSPESLLFLRESSKVTQMIGMGPELLWVRSKFDPRPELAQHAAQVGSRAEVRALEEMIRRELEWLPVKRSASQRLFRWGKKRLGRGEVSLALGPAVWGKRSDVPAQRGAKVREFAGTTLAGMPGVRAGVRPVAAPAPISAAPVFARDCP